MKIMLIVQNTSPTLICRDTAWAVVSPVVRDILFVCRPVCPTLLARFATRLLSLRVRTFHLVAER